MPDNEIPTLDTILNEPNIDRRMNYLVSIAYTNYNSINDMKDRIDDICKERATGLTPKERWGIIGAAIVALLTAVGGYFR